MKNWNIHWRRYKKHCTQDNDTSVPFKVGTLGPHTVLPASLPLFKTLWKPFVDILVSCPIAFSWISSMFWYLFPFKGDFSFGKSQKQPVPVQHSQVFCLLQAFQNVDHFQQIIDHLWSVCATLLFALHSCNILESLLNHLNSFHGGMFKLNAKFDADSLLYWLSHFECDGHTVHMLNGMYLPH